VQTERSKPPINQDERLPLGFAWVVNQRFWFGTGHKCAIGPVSSISEPFGNKG
jgi:hypothetical protein